MTFEENLKKYAKAIGIDLIGITNAEPFDEAYVRLREVERKGYLSPWAEKDLLKRCQPKMLLKGAKSIIGVGISYYSREDSIMELNDGKFRGKLARFAQFLDYHLLLKSKMEELVKFIKDRYPEVEAKIFVDTGPLVDREVAYRAGLGFIGKNSALINPEYGSFVALGEIILNVPLKADIPLENGCGECMLCIQACPQKAIKAPGEIQSNECLAHFTQEKGLLPEDVQKKLGSRLWGCDTCQEVCPYNRNVSREGRLIRHKLGAEPDLEQILDLSNHQYHQLLGDTAMAWRGKTTLQRNALIVLGNQQDKKVIPILKKALKDQRPVIRGTAAWALSQIKDPQVSFLLKEALGMEKNYEVIRVIKKSLTQVGK